MLTAQQFWIRMGEKEQREKMEDGMKKLIMLLIVICGFISLDIYLKYDMGPGEYFLYTQPLTKEEEQWLDAHGGMVYGADASAYPLSFYNEDSRQLEGVLVDYFSHLSIEYGMKVTPVALSWEEVLQALEDGTIMTADLFASQKRREKFDFTYPVYDLSANVVLRNREEYRQSVQTIQDLQGEKLAIVKDDYSQEYLSQVLKWDEENLIEAENIREAMALLDAEKVKAVIGDETVLESYYTGSANAGKYYILEEPLYTMPVRFAVKKGNPILLSILNKSVLQLKKDNIIQKTQSKWYGNGEPIIKDTTRYSITLYIAAAVIFIFILINRWNYVLRRGIKLKTRELEDNKNNIKKIIDTINLGIMVVGADGVIAESNIWIEGFERKQRDQLIGRNLEEQEKLGKIVEAFQQESSKTVTFENLYYEVTTRPIAYMDETKYLVVVDDITKKITDEKMLRQQSKMVAVGHLAAGLAHEIRNPLGLIKSYLFYIGKRSEDRQVIEAVKVCDHSVQRISNLITTLLNFSRQSKQSNQPVDMTTLIDSIVALEGKEASRYGIQIKRICDSVSLSCNEESLKVILINLVDNGIEALSKQEIEAPEVLIAVKKEENAVSIAVSDNGAPIEENVREHIFDPFFTTKEEGTGLGLYLVNNEVEKLGGSLSLTCNEKGNTFHLSISTRIGQAEKEERKND